MNFIITKKIDYGLNTAELKTLTNLLEKIKNTEPDKRLKRIKRHAKGLLNSIYKNIAQNTITPYSR